ncbi:MAG TPA: hypothetical protein VK184_08970 [Nostocaceae cyanobacterium]|nr:hypothetical protein [Nostocaceae cyanobacterium]
MLAENFTQNLPAFLGFAIGSSWLVYKSLQIAYKIDLIKIVNDWLNSRKIVLPTLLTVTLPFIFTYLTQEIPVLIEKWKLDKFVGIFGAVIGAILGFLISEFRQ